MSDVRTTACPKACFVPPTRPPAISEVKTTGRMGLRKLVKKKNACHQSSEVLAISGGELWEDGKDE